MAELAIPLALRLAHQLDQLTWNADAIAAVPLYPSREHKRGYNQSKLLAQEMAAAVGLPDVSDALTRVVDTRPQVGLGREARLTNVADAFVADTAIIRAHSIILVDDVMTTGATLRACATAMVAAGARQVYGLTLSVAS